MYDAYVQLLALLRSSGRGHLYCSHNAFSMDVCSSGDRKACIAFSSANAIASNAPRMLTANEITRLNHLSEIRPQKKDIFRTIAGVIFLTN